MSEQVGRVHLYWARLHAEEAGSGGGSIGKGGWRESWVKEQAVRQNWGGEQIDE